MEQLLSKFFAEITNKLKLIQTQLTQKIEQSQAETKKLHADMTIKIEGIHTEITNKLEQISGRLDALTNEHENTKKQVHENRRDIHAIQDTIKGVTAETNEMKGKIDLHEKEINIIKSKQDKEIRILREEMNNSMGGPIQIVSQCKNFQDETLKFYRYIYNPLEFLKRIEQNFKRTKTNLWQDPLVLLHQYFEKDHNIWLNVIQENVSSYDEFVIRFKNKYWNPTIQQEHRNILETRKYDPNRGLRASQY